jgi:autotransporter-associated beta strand protein
MMQYPKKRSRVAVAVAAVVAVGAASKLDAQVLAFPGAEGFGAYATGARTSLSSATVYHVTNLNDSGAGSFRDAVSQPNRFVVFDVGGIINISSVIQVKNNITIAGQTAPGGISIYGDRLSYTSANNTISRYFAVRKGNAGVRADSLSIARGTNMIFDHMSVTWGVDETFSMNPDSGYVIDNITIQNTIIAQGQDRLGHSAGGLMTLNEGSRFSVIKSLFADNVTRNPKVRGENEYINNVVYGWQTAAYIMGDTTNMDSHANVIGNYFIEGPKDGGSPFSSGTANFHIYGRDNWVDTNRNGVLDGSRVTSYPGADVVATPFAFPTTASMTAQQALSYVLDHVGVSIIRDAVDTRIVNEVRSYGTLGGVIQRETDLFPNYGSDPKYLNPRARLTDGDNDGIADNWELAHGLSPAIGGDWKNLNAQGYTRLEEYVNELGADGVTIPSAGGAWTLATTWGGTPPTLADDAVVIGDMSITAGNAFARRLTLGGNLAVSSGTLDVFDTAALSGGKASLTGGTVTLGQLLLGLAGKPGTLSLSSGATLQTGTIASNGGTALFDWNGGTLRATGTPDVRIPTTLGAAGGTFDTNGYTGTFSGQISGTGALIKTGAGTLTLSGNNSYSGGTTVTGQLKLAHNNAAGTGAISITSAGGAVQLANGITIANAINTSYNFEILDVPDAGAAATFAGNLTRNGSSQVRLQASGSGATLNITGTVSAPNGFYFKTGNLNLRGNGSITGSGGAIGRGGGATTFLLRDNASFNIGGFSMGGGQALPSASIRVIQNAQLSTGTGSLDLLNTSSAKSTSQLQLDGGTTTLGGIIKTSTGATQTSTINFNGGILRYGGATANTNFLPALAGLTANVQAGGGRIDTNGQALTIAQPLVHDAALATADGGLTKLGAGTLTLTGTNTYNGPTTVTGGTLAVGNGGTGGALGPGAITNNASLLFNRSNVITLANTIGGGGSLIQAGAGTLVLTGASSYSGRTIVNAGAIVFSTAAHSVGEVGGAGKVQVAAGATVTSDGVTAGSWQIDGTHVIRPGGAAAGASKVAGAGLAIAGSMGAWTGKLDLNDNALILTAADAAAQAVVLARVRDQVATARAGGTWTGSGITSSAMTDSTFAAANSLAIVDAGDLGLTSFRGQLVDAHTTLVVTAHSGDATLDGIVDAFDLNILAAHWQQGSGALWSSGDFNGDGMVDAFDLNVLAAQWQYGMGGTLVSGQSFEAALAAAFGAAAVPEPASLALLGLTLPWLLRRRR